MAKEVLTVLDINGETGETVERELTAEEIAQRETLAAQIAQAEAEAQAKAAARESALAKLGDLGLTAEEIAAL
jgi:hypothetical protein